MNLLLVVSIALRIGVLIKSVFDLIKPYLPLIVFVTATPILMHFAAWPERVLIGLSIASAGLLSARMAVRVGLPRILE